MHLSTLREELEDQLNISISTGSAVNLYNIYKLIESINDVDEIATQMHFVRETRKRLLKEFETEVRCTFE